MNVCRKAERPLSAHDRAELERFEAYLRRRADNPSEPHFVSYGEVYGEIVFEDTSREDGDA
jgi:hypothetical protein